MSSSALNESMPVSVHAKFEIPSRESVTEQKFDSSNCSIPMIGVEVPQKVSRFGLNAVTFKN